MRFFDSFNADCHVLHRMVRGSSYYAWRMVIALLVISDAEGRQDPGTRQLMEVYCFDCHNSKKKEGQVRLDDLGPLSLGNSALWTKVFEQVSLGKMPPGDETARNLLLEESP